MSLLVKSDRDARRASPAAGTATLRDRVNALVADVGGATIGELEYGAGGARSVAVYWRWPVGVDYPPGGARAAQVACLGDVVGRALAHGYTVERGATFVRIWDGPRTEETP